MPDLLINFHTHNLPGTDAELCVRNLFPGQLENFKRDSSREFYSAGLHPWYVKKSALSSDLEKVKRALENPKIIAIGETGLDRGCKTDWELQLQAFREQLKLAQAVRKPVIIHCVRAYPELTHERKNFEPGIPWIIHRFSGNLQAAEQLLKFNCYFSFGPDLLKTDSKAYRALPQIPEDRFLLETDDADIAVAEVYQAAAKLRNTGFEEIRKIQIQNFRKIFKKELT